MTHILFIGDISAKPGRLAVKEFLAEKKKDYDLVIANGENAAHGVGATIEIIEELHSYGVDYFTSGNDIWHKDVIFEYLNDQKGLLIRPMNYPAYYPGKGYKLMKVNGKNILLINLIGTVFIKEQVLNPFRTVEEFLGKVERGSVEDLPERIDSIIVDFHAEATSEKVTMGFFLDGRVSAILGTHTHVQTADERILPKGSAYITDVGMSGSLNSVLWVKYESVIVKMMNPYHFERFEVEESKPWLVNAVSLSINETNVVESIQRTNYQVN
jgi:metallophosphoesterase (TIGR00282 family)